MYVYVCVIWMCGVCDVCGMYVSDVHMCVVCTYVVCMWDSMHVWMYIYVCVCVCVWYHHVSLNAWILGRKYFHNKIMESNTFGVAFLLWPLVSLPSSEPSLR